MAEPMGKGISKYWTPQTEEHFNNVLARVHTFAERDLIMTVRDLLKYDHRTKEGKKAIAKARIRLATATDRDLQQMAELAIFLEGSNRLDAVPERVKDLKETRAKIREKGIKRSELTCQ